MKEIYENIFNDDIVKSNGRKNHERGSFWAMQCNYSTLLNVVNTLLNRYDMKHDDRVLIFYNIKSIVSKEWDGIGEWRD